MLCCVNITISIKYVTKFGQIIQNQISLLGLPISLLKLCCIVMVGVVKEWIVDIDTDHSSPYVSKKRYFEKFVEWKTIMNRKIDIETCVHWLNCCCIYGEWSNDMWSVWLSIFLPCIKQFKRTLTEWSTNHK